MAAFCGSRSSAARTRRWSLPASARAAWASPIGDAPSIAASTARLDPVQPLPTGLASTMLTRMDRDRRLLRMAILLALLESPTGLTGEELAQRSAELLALGEDGMRQLGA